MKKSITRLLSVAGLLLCGLCAPAWSQTGDQVLGPLKGVSSLSLYAKAYDAKAQGKLPVKEAGFPLPVLEVDGDFLKVKLAGKEVWLDGAEVQVDKPVAYGCVKDERKPTKTASIQGASTGCK